MISPSFKGGLIFIKITVCQDFYIHYNIAPTDVALLSSDQVTEAQRDAIPRTQSPS